MAANRPNGATLLRNSLGEKQCRTCSEWKAERFFARHGKTLDRLQVSCFTCINQLTKERKYGLTETDIRIMLKAQNYSCAICSDSLLKSYAIDHDHECCGAMKACMKCVRGLLCHTCNLGLGSFRDNRDTLASAITYLTNHKENQ